MSFKEELVKTFKTRFISGVLVVVPLFVAIAVLRFLIVTVDDFVKPYLVSILGQEYGFPFIGLGVTIILIILVGIITTNVLGQRLLGLWELVILRIPLFSTVYSASKQLVEGFAVPEKRTFEKVVLVEYPRKGCLALGFVANHIKIRSSVEEKEYLSVFIPSTPTPFTGIAILYPSEDVAVVDITVEEALKFLVSASVSAPPEMQLSKFDAIDKRKKLQNATATLKRKTGAD